jgi:Fic family protein
MFKPCFDYDHELVNLLTEISSANAVVQNTKLKHSHDLLLKNKAIVDISYSSNAISENSLSLKEVRRLFNGEDLVAPYIEKRKLLNYFHVLENIDKYCDNEITEENILSLHRDLTTDTVDNQDCPGNYRCKTFNFHSNNHVDYVEPGASEISDLMTDLVEWINFDNPLHPVILAALAHHELLRIRPFSMGNGKTARLLMNLILYLKKFDIIRYYSIDAYLYGDVESYKYAIVSALLTEDSNKWLEYFLQAVLISISKKKDEVLSINNEKCIVSEDKQVPISAMEIKIFQFLRKNHEIRNKDVQNILGISYSDVFKYIQKLLDADIIMAKGMGRSTYYVLKH